MSRAERNIEWIETHCYVPDGKLAGQRVQLTDHQKLWMISIYDSPTRTFILSMPRKNAKTALSAFLLLLHLVGPEAVRNGQLYSSANSRDQAAILFKYAAASVRLSPTLSDFVSVKDSAKSIECPQLGTVYRALSADAKTAHGLSPVFIVHDELGQVKGSRSELYDTLETGSAAHDNPLSIIISTQASTDNDLLSLLIDDALQGEDPKRKVILCTYDGEHVYSDEALNAANPHFGDFMNQDELRDIAKRAQRMPSLDAAYRNLHLNQRIAVDDKFISLNVWKENSGKPETWRGQRVWAGLDLSAVSDLTSLVLLTESGDVHCFNWLPADGIHDKAARDRVDWPTYAKNGHLELIPGRTISYDFVAQRLLEIFNNCDVQAIAFDRYNMRFLIPELQRLEFSPTMIDKFREFGQGFVSMSPAIRTLEELLLNQKLRHGNNAVLNICAHNVTTQSDPAGNRKFVKPDSRHDSGRKIDAMVSLAMAVGVRQSHELEEKKPKLKLNALKFY